MLKKFRLPLLSNFNLVGHLVFALLFLSLILGMPNDLIEVLRLDSVEDIKEVIAWWELEVLVGVWEEHIKLGIFLNVLPEMLDTQLIIVGNNDGPQLRSGN